MTHADLECLKSHVDQIVDIDTKAGEHIIIRVIFVFDEEPEPDVFFWDITDSPAKESVEQTRGYSLPLDDIISVRPSSIK